MGRGILCLLILVTCFSCHRDKIAQSESSKLLTPLDSNSTGINFINLVNDTGEYNLENFLYLYNGGGVAVGDINNDGLPDIFFTGNRVNSRLYLNLGNFRFKDITDSAGINTLGGWTTGCTMVDVNGDGLLDIYVCKSGNESTKDKHNLLFINQGNLKFKESAAAYGLDDNGASTQAVFFDYDNDGDLDAYIVNHPENFRRATDFIYYTNGVCDSLNSDRLYENIGGKFHDVSRKAGLPCEKGFGLSASVADINNDGLLDLYVSNDFFAPDYLYMNTGIKSFVNRANILSKMSSASMGVDIADINNDGRPDIITAEMAPEGHARKKSKFEPLSLEYYSEAEKYINGTQFSRNMLQVQNVDGSFSEIGDFAGVARTDWSWSPIFADFDNDGFKDLFISNGTEKDLSDMDHKLDMLTISGRSHKRNYRGVIDQMSSTQLRNYIFKNNGNGTFSQVMDAWGIRDKFNSQGAAIADLDLDGYPDLIVNPVNHPACIYRNNGKKITNNSYISIKLVGYAKNTQGLGTKIKLYSPSGFQYWEVETNKGFESSSEAIAHFGLGHDTIVDSLEIIWLNGMKQTLKNIKANRTLTVYASEAHDKVSPSITPPGSNTLLRESDELVKPLFKHRESDFIDFKRDKIIPHMVSREGPKIATGDVNGDGLTDFFIGGAKGMNGGRLYLQKPSGSFELAKDQPWEADSLYEDVAAVFFDANGDGFLDLYIASGSNEQTENSPFLQDRLYINDGHGKFKKAVNCLPSMLNAKSCVIAYDYDGDGKQDLFVGGRMVPGRYGLAPKSYLLHNEGGWFRDVTNEVAPGLQDIGMVTDAVWSDYDNDGRKDLIVVGEWMPVTVFKNEGAKFKKLEHTGIENNAGWWTSITAGDINGDGIDEYIVGNMGYNSELKASESSPVTLYVSDFDNNGTTDAVMFHYLSGINAPYVGRDLFCKQMPMYWKKFTTYESFAKATISDIFTTEQLAKAKQLKATDFATSIVYSKGDGSFSMNALPLNVQQSPVNAIAIADIDNDGKPEIILGGNTNCNFYDQGNIDASEGWILKSDGKEGFRVLEPDKSGFNCGRMVIRDIKPVHNAARGTTVLLVGINDDEMKVFETVPVKNTGSASR
jgi:hypothetical protein